MTTNEQQKDKVYIVQERGRNCFLTIPQKYKKKYNLKGGDKVLVKNIVLEVVE